MISIKLQQRNNFNQHEIAGSLKKKRKEEKASDF
jgi:hypothetical protein